MYGLSKTWFLRHFDPITEDMNDLLGLTIPEHIEFKFVNGFWYDVAVWKRCYVNVIGT